MRCIFLAITISSAIFLGGSLLTHADSQQVRTVWTVSGRRILLNGEVFFAKGVNYSPTPVGGSANWSPFGDWFTSTWHEIYERDLPKLRQMGANSIRVHCWYALEPTQDNYRRVGVADFENETANDHTHFLDRAWNDGINPIYVLVTLPLEKARIFYYGSDEAKIDDSADVFKFYEWTIRWAAKKYGKHPAVMGFSIGNECNDEPERLANPLFWERMNKLARAAKAEAPDKLVTSVWFPHPREHFLIYPQLLLDENFDVTGINLYDIYLKSSEFWDLYRAICLKNGEAGPVLVTEFGASACEHRPDGRMVATPRSHARQAQWIERKWKEILSQSVLENPSEGIVSGGYVFSWSDEWWKTHDSHGSAAVQDPGDISQPSLPDGWQDEECFGINAIRPHPGRPARFVWNPEKGSPYPPDILTPRDAYHMLQALWMDPQNPEVPTVKNIIATIEKMKKN